MKRILFEYLPLGLLLVVLGGVVIHAPLTVYLGTIVPELAVPLKAWKEVLILFAGVLIAIRMAQTGQWSTLKKDHFGWVIIAFWSLHAISLIWSHGSMQSIVAGLLIDLRFTVFAACVYHFLLLYPRYLKLFLITGVIGACVVVSFAAIELILPHDFLKVLGYGPATIEPYMTVDKNPDYIRFNSTLRGPNSLGAYAAMVLSSVAAYLLIGWNRIRARNKTLAIILGVLGIVALIVSYSRSAVIATVVGVVIAVCVRYSHLAKKFGVTLGLVAVVLIVAVGWMVKDSSFVDNVILHNNPTTGAALDSNTAHADSLKQGFTKMLAEPLGSGIGSTGSASLLGARPTIIENSYLMIAHEVGWLGLVLFVWIYVVFLARCYKWRRDWLALAVFTSGIGLGVIGLLLPVWADDTISLVWWGLASTVLARGYAKNFDDA